MLMRMLLSGSAIAFLLGAVTATADESDQSKMGGRDLYMTYQCWQCHGYEGQGGAAARLAATDYPFEAFARFVRHPNVMPAYTPNLLSDEKLSRIYEYIRSIPKPPALEDIRALRDN